MGFGDSVRYGFEHYVDFSGRSSRPSYWWWFLFGILAGIGANILDAIFGGGIISILVGLALLLPGLSYAARRLHDINRTGWWLLIGILPLIGLIVLIVFLVQRGDAGENQYGPPPPDAAPAAAPAT